MTGKRWAYRGFRRRQRRSTRHQARDAEEIIEFASEFDPQPMHLDEAAGKASILGGLSASGWHTCAMFMRLLCDAFLLDSTSQGAPGIDYVRWKKPVLAGDTLTAHSHGAGQARCRSRAARSASSPCRSELRNQHGESVLELENTGHVPEARRSAGA